MEKRAFRISGFLMLLILLLIIVGEIVYVVGLADEPDNVAGPRIGVSSLVSMFLVILLATGLTILGPNEARVIQFFGRYIGTIRTAGLHWTVPFTTRRRITLRVRNFETPKLKVSDADGNPVEIAAVVVWKVTDSAKAAFAVDDHVNYVAIQAETAVRHLATTYPYDAHDPERPSLRDGAHVSEELTAELRERVELAGVEVVETRITHLAYAPEIAQVMLQRQQANAVVAARSRIVEGAVGMVQMALDRLREQSVVELDEDRKAQMVSNLLVVLCGDRATQPVVNTGTLYG
jgi:regulator of protease activity HflC (stomatin/prohibitin superfamily)